MPTFWCEVDWGPLKISSEYLIPTGISTICRVPENAPGLFPWCLWLHKVSQNLQILGVWQMTTATKKKNRTKRNDFKWTHSNTACKDKLTKEIEESNHSIGSDVFFDVFHTCHLHNFPLCKTARTNATGIRRRKGSATWIPHGRGIQLHSFKMGRMHGNYGHNPL